MKVDFKSPIVIVSNSDIDSMRWFILDTPYDWYDTDGFTGRVVAIKSYDRVLYFSPPNLTGHDNISVLGKKGFEFVRYLDEDEKIIFSND